MFPLTLRIFTDICVIGAGPAGSVFAMRMAQLGHAVCLIERVAFPRRHLGESLSPGVLPLLDALGAGDALRAVEFPRVRTVSVNWDQGPRERTDPAEQGRLVDRGRFDQLLVDQARASGVHVLQPATLTGSGCNDEGWTLRIVAGGRAVELRAAFFVDATGRAGLRPARRRRTGPRTLALHAYWRGSKLPTQPRIEAGKDAWYWGVPLPDGTYNTLVFTEAGQGSAGRFRELLDGSGLLQGCGDLQMIGRIRGSDATPYLAEECVTPRSIMIGDAALAIDPLSSSGVQKAIQSALSGAIVANTLLREPEAGAAAMRYHRDNLREASERHRVWAAEHYGLVAAQRGGRFWGERAAAAPPTAEPAAREPARAEAKPARLPPSTRLVLSADVQWVDVPCIVGAFVRMKSVLRHPALDRPVGYLGNRELAPLLRQWRAGMTMREGVFAWAGQISWGDSVAIAEWLVARRLLVPEHVTTVRGASQGGAGA